MARNRGWLLVALTILVVVVVRVRLLQMPLERDEGEYAYAGQLILHGVAPYQEASNMKLPGTYAAYALIMGTFGQSSAGIHFGLILVNMASVIFVFLLGRRLLDETAGVVSAVCFTLLSLSPSVLGLQAHATHFVVLFALAGMVLLGGKDDGWWMMDDEGRRSVFKSGAMRLLASGLLFGMAFLMKQHGIFFGIFGAVYLVWKRVLERLAELEDARKWRGPSFRRAATVAAVPTAGVAAPRLSLIAQAKESKVQGRESKVQSPKSKVQTAESEVHGGLQSKVLGPQSTVEGAESEVQGPKSKVEAPNAERPKVQSPGPKVQSPEITTLKSIFAELAVFASGWMMPYVLTCLVLLVAGGFSQFWFWTVSYAAKYAAAVPLVNGPELLKAAVSAAVGPNIVLWLLPWAGLWLMWWDRRMRGAESARDKAETGNKTERRKRESRIENPRLFLTLLLFCSLASVSVGLYFRGHYFITLLPVLALLTGVAVSRGLYLLEHDRTIELFVALPVLLAFAVAVCAAIIGNGSVWFSMSPREAVQEAYQSTVFGEAADAAAYIKANSAKGARIAVLGSEPEIYFLSGRRSASGYIYTYPLMEKHEFASKMQREMISEIERARPEYVVYVDDDLSWLVRETSDQTLFNWWKGYMATNLDLVSTTEIKEGGVKDPRIEKRPAPETAEVTKHLLVFKRKGG
ncbi:MAG TPA: hypothetical protein VN578_16995 [Candidatus Binatia bacterium]|jgi:hypothetical protein|nr:hypothetical protein [Candidatus Binatia bacterium]